MERSWNEFADTEIGRARPRQPYDPGEPDRVNRMIEDVESLDPDERADLFEQWFEDLSALYAEHEDGYVRQSVVRVAEQFAFGLMPAVVRTPEDEDELERISEQTDTLCGFMLVALTDEDGRVRQSAKRGLQDVFRAYDALEETETLEALAAELDEMADEYSCSRRKHLLETKDDALFHQTTGFSRLAKSLRWEVDGFDE